VSGRTPGRGLALPAGQFRRDDLGVIHRGDDVAVTGQVRGDEAGRLAVPAAVVGEDDQRMRSGAGQGVAPGLGLLAGPHQIPELHREQPAAPGVGGLDG
jgi:hypothetical protein